MGLEDVYYIASELNKEDCNFIKDYLDLIKVKNKVIPLNLTKDYEKLNKIKVDIAFLFKTLDSLEKIKRNISKDLLKNINSRYIAVSFAIKSLSGRKPIKERGWFYRILRELDLNFKTFETENEIFFIMTSSPH